MQSIPLPRTVDEPPYFLLWRIDDLFAPCLLMVVGLMFERMMGGLALGLVLSLVYRRFRDGRPENYVLHAIYWSGLWPGRGYSFPNPFARIWWP
ncbi:type IV conjugative transfer system protein TraL [Pseudoroseomonas sp. WGS1072]|uniref:type IV conjugative transfer system protein TraL n=1 Tax=Roseomonas sp. WGS1072 TaxID=3366816 RepID=UPI003BF1A2B7